MSFNNSYFIKLIYFEDFNHPLLTGNQTRSDEENLRNVVTCNACKLICNNKYLKLRFV